MKPGDRLVCAFVKAPPLHAPFKEWPLHVTIVPWFRTAIKSEELAAELQETLGDISPFEAAIDSSAQFGYRKGKRVALVQSPSPFFATEKRVRSVLKKHRAWLADETTKRKRPFKPHVTDQRSAQLQEGVSFRCNRLHIVEQKGGHKEAVAVIGLGHEQKTA